jgi:hypothetical protein
LIVCHSTFSIITSLYNTTIDSIVQFYYRNRAHATEDGNYIQDRGYILGQRKGAASSLSVYCAFALALLEQNIATTPTYRVLRLAGSTGRSLRLDGRCHRRRIRIRKGYVTQAFHIYPQALFVNVTLHQTPKDKPKHTIHNKRWRNRREHELNNSNRRWIRNKRCKSLHHRSSIRGIRSNIQGNQRRTTRSIYPVRLMRSWKSIRTCTRTRTENRIKGDVSTKAGCLAIADALTKAGVSKVYPYPLCPIVSIEETD